MKAQYQAIGFAFEGYDRGLSTQIGDVIRGFRSIEDMLPATNKAMEQTESALTGIFSNLKTSFDGFKQMMQPAALSTGFEDQITAMDKDLRRLGVNAGYTGKQLSQFKGRAMGMAMSMKIGAEEASDAVAVWNRASSELKAVGIDSDRTLAKFANVSGMKAGDLAKTLKSMRAEFQFTDADLKMVSSSFYQLGMQTGHVDEVLQDMPKTIELMRQKAQGFGVDLPSDKLARFASQTAVLSGALAKATGNASEARDIAFAFSNTMLKARTNFLDTFSGKGEFSEMFKSVGQGFGDIGIAMDSMNQGPAEFMAVMAKMVLTAKKNGQDLARPLAFVEARFREAFDPQQAAAMSALFRGANEDVLKTLSTVNEGTAALGKYAKEGFTAGWTLSESFERTKDVLELNFRKIGKSAATDFVKQSSVSFKQFGNELKEMAADGGPVGKLVVKLSEASHLGGLVFLPERLRPMGALFGTINEKMAPVIEQGAHLTQTIVPALTAGFIGLRAVLSPRGLLLTGALGLGTYLYSLTEAGTKVRHVIEKLEDVAYGAAEGFTTLLEKIPDFIDEAGIVVNKFFDSLTASAGGDEASGRWGEVWTRMSAAGLRAIDSIGGVLQNLGYGFWNALTGTIDPEVSTTASGRLGGAIGRAVVWAWEWLKDETPIVFNAVGEFVDDMWTGLWSNLAGVSVPTDSVDQAGVKIGQWVGDTASKAADWLLSWAIANPGKASVLSFAAGGPAGPALAAFISGAAIGDAAESWWTNDNFDARLKARVNAAVNAAGISLGDIAQMEQEQADGWAENVDKAWKQRYDSLSAQAQRGAQDFLGQMRSAAQEAGKGWIVDPEAMVNDWWADIEAAGGAEIERFAEFSLQSSSDIDRRWREHATEQLSRWFLHLDDVSGAWNKKFGGSMTDTFDQIKTALDDHTFYDKVKSIEGLDHLQVQFQYTEEEIEASADKVRRTLQGLIDMNRPTIDMFKNLKKTYYDQTPALQSLDLALVGTTLKMQAMSQMGEDQWNKLSKGADQLTNKLSSMASKNLGWLMSDKTQTTTQKTKFIQTSEVDEKQLKGNADVIRRATSDVAKNLDGPLRKSVELVLETAFNKAYENIDLGTKKFADAQSKNLSKIAETIEDKLAAAWIKVLEQTSAATKAIVSDVVYVQTAVRSSESMFAKLMSLRKAADDVALKESGGTRKDREFDSTTEMGKLLEATLWPDWYDDYKEWFQAKMAELIQATKSSNSPVSTAITVPTSTASDALLKKKGGPFPAPSGSFTR